MGSLNVDNEEVAEMTKRQDTLDDGHKRARQEPAS